MNSTQPRFVDREDELKRIAELATVWGTLRILVVDGPGGIGKSCLLEEVYRHRQDYMDALRGQLKVSRVINLDDMSFHTPVNLGRRIADELGATKFRDYLDKTDRALLLESKGLLTQESFGQYRQEIDNLFLTTCRALAKEERILLIFDTLEALLPLPVASHILSVMTQFQNAFVLFAGREGEKAHAMLAQFLQESPSQVAILEYLKLEAFAPPIAMVYLDQTPIKSYLETHPHLRDNLLLLTEGRPLLLALAAEWLRRDVPLPELTDRTPSELRAVPKAEMDHLRQQFEKALVSHIRNLREETADLILDMAHFSLRFDDDLLSAVTGMSAEESAQKVKSLEGLFFVKQKPRGSLALHDEMQRLIEMYVWPEIDPFGTRRKQLSEKAVVHYRHRLEQLDRTTNELEMAIRAAEERQDLAAAAEARRAYLEQKRLRWILARELLHYTLDADLTKGYELFVDEFDAASTQYQFMLRRGLVQEIASCEHKFPDPLKYEVSIRIAKHHLDEAEYELAKTHLLEMQVESLSSSMHADLQLQLGNAEVRLGNFEQGINHFQEAVKVSQVYGLEKALAQAENALGWGCRLIGDWDAAALHYRKALKLALKQGAQRQQGWLLNNLAFVYATQNKRDEALQLSEQALKVWTLEGFKRGLGAAHSTHGSVLYKFGQFEQALIHFAEALAIFESQDDLDWLSTVYSWRGVTLWAMEHLEEARADLEKAQRIGLKRDAAMILNRLARVYRGLGQNDAARDLLNQSYQAALETKDSLYEAATLSDLAALEVDEGHFSTLDTFQKELDLHLQRKSPHALPLGRLRRHMGTLALGLGRIDEAMDYYKRGLELIVERGSYGTVSLTTELNDLERTLKELAQPDFIRQLGAELGQYWEAKELDASNPEALPIFVRWEQWSGSEQETGHE